MARLTVLMPVGPTPRPHFLSALHSLRNDLPSPDAQLLVIFDGQGPSPEESFLLGELRARVEILTKCQNVGQVLNTGLKLIDTPLTSRIDSDDLWPSGRLLSQLEFMEANRSCVVAGSDATTVDGQGHTLGSLYGGQGGDLRHALLLRNQLLHPTTVFRTEAAMKVGGYPDVARVEDYALWLRLAHLGSVLNSPARWVLYRIHSTQQSRQPISRSASVLIRRRRAELARCLGVRSFYPALAHLAWSAAQLTSLHGFRRLWSRFEWEHVR